MGIWNELPVEIGVGRKGLVGYGIYWRCGQMALALMGNLGAVDELGKNACFHSI